MSKGQSDNLASAISRHLAASLLPGDVTFTAAELTEAARFVCKTAASRKSGKPAIAIETVPGALGERLMRIVIINDDMPFIVDSVAAAIAAQGLAIDRLLHPVVAVRRDQEGLLLDLPRRAAAADSRESVVYVETARADARTRVQLRAALEAALADVRAAVTDWPKLRTALTGDADELAALAIVGFAESSEGADLLRWLQGGMLTQLGHVLRQRDGSQSEALGICRKSARELLAPASYKRAFVWFDSKGKQAAAAAPLIVKANVISQVHRRVPLDLFIIPKMARGKVAALSVHAGIWTSAALAAPPDTVPRMRSQLTKLAGKLGFAPGSHAGKALVHAMTALPHDLLVGFDETDLERTAIAMISLVDRPRAKLLLVRAPLDRHLFAFVWLPRDAVSTSLRKSVKTMLESAAQGLVLDWSLEVEEGSLALLRFVIDVREGGGAPDEKALDQQLQAMLRGWSEAVEAALADGDEPGRAAALATRYADAFPLAYRSIYGPADAATDIARLRHLPGGDSTASSTITARLATRLHRMAGDSADRLRLKIYESSGNLTLSDAVPVLENFGFIVIENFSTALDAGRLGGVDDFLLSPPRGRPVEDLLARAAAIETAINAVLNGTAESDPFNRLILAIGLSDRETGWLRAWYRYMRQTGMSFGSPTVVDALQHAPQVTRGILDLFISRHDPGFVRDRAKAETAAQIAIREGLSLVAAINDDRLLRQYKALVEAMLRTNAFLPSGEAALAFKLDSALVPGLPKPVPWREIFVFSPQVEGIHLRAGPIARGGLRWSDRRDDFRTEVLGLMKAQRVKNAVIVPTGAKGGFYPKRLPDPAKDRDGWLAEGKASYQTFVRALLSLTDNIVGGKVIHPRGMVVRDADDPYFVVAADKGTASYSDTANALAAEANFWLDDAFASGGSKGYDHKAMGITARGAWLSVQRHFRELGTDVQSDSVQVVGCGDMSGDVFGNGMLLSKTLKLVAAFDHRHIFLDPDPDPAKSWAERARMFALPRSSWEDYDKKLISKGGGTFPRSLKQIPLSPQVRAVLGIAAESADPETLISAILTSPVDMLWFGGIGTYVKAASENNIQVGDPANDVVRINGAEIRAKVIGEGANLGCTQAGRIEFAQNGGRINTDFIDNSAGVDCSDKEVNIKIALASAQRDGRLTEPARVKLLVAMTDDVAALVLEDNRLQALALSIAQAGGAQATGSYLRLIDMLEERGQLDRKTEGLADSETLVRRAADSPGGGGGGLVRPELATLLSSAKLALQEALEDSRLPDDPGLEAELFAAFPPAMRSKFKADIRSHRLRREIIATRITNRLVNRIGMIHPFELVEEEGASLAQVAGAFVAAEQLFAMEPVWQAIELAEMPEQARILLNRRSASAMRIQMADLLRAGVGAVQPSLLIAELAGGVTEISQNADNLLGGEARLQSERLRSEFSAAGAPVREAAMVAHLADLDGAVGLCKLARKTGLAIPALTHAFSAIGASLGLDWVQATASQLRPADPWERLLTASLARDFQQIRIEFLRRICSKKGDPLAAVEGWVEDRADAVRQFRAMVARAQTAAPVTPTMLAQIAGQARNVLSR
jgi:glutamate dehydrogenase